MTKRERGFCRVCGGNPPLRKDGKFYGHTVGGGPYGPDEKRDFCTGTEPQKFIVGVNEASPTSVGKWRYRPIGGNTPVQVKLCPTTEGYWTTHLLVGDNDGCYLGCQKCNAVLSLKFGEYKIRHDCPDRFEVEVPRHGAIPLSDVPRNQDGDTRLDQTQY